MSTQKGNQKHLNLSDRINIEKGLNNNDSFATIAKVVQKDPTTISKEVRKHSKVKEYKGYANTPSLPILSFKQIIKSYHIRNIRRVI